MTTVPDVGPLADFAVSASGDVYVVGWNSISGNSLGVLRLAHLNVDGSVDSAFGPGGVLEVAVPATVDLYVHDVVAVGDGGLLIAASARAVAPGPFEEWLIRVAPDGSLVSTFGTNGILVADPPTCDGVYPQSTSDSVDLIAASDGTFAYRQTDRCQSGFGGRADSAIARIDSDGQLIGSFANNGWWVTTGVNVVNEAELIGVDQTGRVIITNGGQVTRLAQAGTPDATFATIGVGRGRPGLNPATDGVLVVRAVGPGGEEPPETIELHFYTPDGDPDPLRPPLLLDPFEGLLECPFTWQTFVFTASGAAYVRPNLSNGCLEHVYLVDRTGAKVDNWGDGGFGDFTTLPQGQSFDNSATSQVSDDQYALVYTTPWQVIRVAADIAAPVDVYPDAERGREQNPSSDGPTVDSGDPVNTATGALVEQVTDIAAPAGAPHLSWTRSYNSQRTATGVLGPGWTAPWSARLDVDVDGATFTNDHGAEYSFTRAADGSFERRGGLLADLVDTGTRMELRWFNGDVTGFDSLGREIEHADWAGNGAVATRNPDGLLDTVVATTGASLTFTYTPAADGSQRLASVTASDGRTAQYAYDDTNPNAPGLLLSVTNPHGTESYTHDDAGRITSATDGAGVVTHITEYGSDDRVARQVLATGEVTTFSFDEQTRTMTVTDVSSGDVVAYHYGTDARLISITDPLGSIVSTTWNNDDQLTGSTDRLGHAPSATHDANGNLTSMTDPVRGTTTYVYDGLNRVVSVTEPTGATTTLTYEGSERLPSSVTDGLGNTTIFDVVDGLVVSATDPDGVTVTYGYDAQRRVTSTTNGLGDTWTYGYDAVGRRTSETTPLGHVTARTFDDAGRMLTSTGADGGVTTYSYDAEGRIVSVTDPVGAVTSNTFDQVTGLLATTTDPMGRATSYSYDALGQLTAVTSNDGAVTETDYGTLGRVTATRDALDREVTYAYDANGNRTEVVAPDGGVSRTEYDTAGRITALEDPLGRRTSHSYDEFGRLVTVTEPDGTTMSYTYDLLGRGVTVTAPDGGVTSTGFTAAGRTDTVTDPEGGVTSYGYDLAGRLASVTDANLKTTSIVYDADGRRTGVTTPEGLVTSWEYDPVGRITKIIDPAGVSMTRTYTLRGEVETEQRSGDGQVAYVYNLDGTLGSVTDAVGNTTSFTYDTAGRRATRIDATGAVEAWEYNPAGELVAQTDRLGNQATVAYDPNGRIESVVDASGRSTSHTYNTAGELLSRAFGDGTTVSYTYDDMGRRTSMVDPTGTTTYMYDPAGRPTEIASPSGTLGYGYDLAGRRTSLTYPDGTAATYTYDPAGRLTAVAEPSVGTVSYALDDDGRLTQTSLPNGQTRDFGYTDGRLTSHVDQGRATTITYDNSGRIATLAGADNHTYTYDLAGQLLEAVQDNGTFAYAYGNRGEITSISDPDRTRSFDHNENAEITTITDDAGDTGGATYDEAGRMVEHVDPDGTITSYNYDARGLLVEVVVTIPADPSDDSPCAELTPTIVGTDGDDIIEAGNGVDIIFAGDGNDIINGGNGADIICAGPGNDTIIGGNGADVIDAGPGDDHIDAGNGADTVTGGPGNDTLIGDKGDDVLAGGYGFDTIDGGQGNDICEDDNPTACETLTPTAEPPAPSVTIESRTYDGDGTLTGIDITQPDGATTTDSLLWDTARSVPQVMTWTADGGSDNLVYGYQRELTAGLAEQYNTLGDALSGGTQWSPFGPIGDRAVLQFGYRAELEATATVFLRARDLHPTTGLFTDIDPLHGVAGTSTFGSPYPYANNDPINLIDPRGLSATDAGFQGPVTGTTMPPSVPTATSVPTAVGPQPGDVRSDGHIYLCGPPSGPATAQTPGFCDWSRPSGGLPSVSELRFDAQATIDQVAANASGWLSPGTGVCAGGQTNVLVVTVDLQACIVALRNEAGVLGSVGTGGGVGVAGVFELGTFVTNAQFIDQLKGLAVCGSASAALGLGVQVTVCVGLRDDLSPNGYFVASTTGLAGGAAGGTLYVSRTSGVGDGGRIWSTISSVLSRLTPSGSAPPTGICDGGVFDPVNRDAMGFHQIDSCP